MSVTQISIRPEFNGKKFVPLKKSASLDTCFKSKAEMWLTTVHMVWGVYKRPDRWESCDALENYLELWQPLNIVKVKVLWA